MTAADANRKMNLVNGFPFEGLIHFKYCKSAFQINASFGSSLSPILDKDVFVQSEGIKKPFSLNRPTITLIITKMQKEPKTSDYSDKF